MKTKTAANFTENRSLVQRIARKALLGSSLLLGLTLLSPPPASAQGYYSFGVGVPAYGYSPYSCVGPYVDPYYCSSGYDAYPYAGFFWGYPYAGYYGYPYRYGYGRYGYPYRYGYSNRYPYRYSYGTRGYYGGTYRGAYGGAYRGYYGGSSRGYAGGSVRGYAGSAGIRGGVGGFRGGGGGFHGGGHR